MVLMDFRMDFRLCMAKRSNGRGARKSTISHAKGLSTVPRANPPPSVESDWESWRMHLNELLNVVLRSMYLHLCVMLLVIMHFWFEDQLTDTFPHACFSFSLLGF